LVYDIAKLISYAQQDAQARTTDRLPVDGWPFGSLRPERDLPTRYNIGWVYGVESQEPSSIKITAVEGIDKYDDPTKAILPTIKWQVEDPDYMPGDTPVYGELYISVFDRVNGLFPGSDNDSIGQLGTAEQKKLDASIFNVFPPVDGDPSPRPLRTITLACVTTSSPAVTPSRMS
jgi:hypothetical protein